MPPKKSATAAAKRTHTTATSETKPTANTAMKRKTENSDDISESDEGSRRSKKAKSQPTTAASTRPSRTPKPTIVLQPSTEETTKKNRNTTKKISAAKTPVKTTDKGSKAKTAAPKAAATKTAAAKTANTKTSATTTAAAKTATAKTTQKRKPPSIDDDTAERAKKVKSPAPAAPKAAPKPEPKKPAKPLPEINAILARRLDVLVFGEGENGELGLGDAKNATGVKRPRVNHFLDATTVGVVQVACGGMHNLALTHDNRIFTWGVNDQGTLGRDTSWEGRLRQIDTGSDSEDDEEETDLNPFESTPTAIDSTMFPEGTRFSQVAAGDSCSFALTTTGQVYGWGTFRANEGILGFSEEVEVQTTPTLIRELKNINSIACGANHVLALDNKGNAYAWGSGQQMQLGRKAVERTRTTNLTPRLLGLPKGKVVQVACGSYHAFAIDKNDDVWAWGLNNFGECGIAQNAGRDEATIGKPTKVPELCKRGIHSIKGGEHHSIAVTGDGDCIVWGRGDGSQLGVDMTALNNEEVIRDASGRIRIVIHPRIVPQLAGKTKMATTGSDHCIAVTNDGQAWSWGFSATYQTGQGSDEDIDIATQIDNTATRARKITGAGCGGQYGIITAEVEVDGH